MNRDQWLAQLAQNSDPLGILLHTYFGQDWLDDHGLPWENVVAAFVQDGPDRYGARALGELDELLADGLSDSDLETMLWDGLHVAFNTEHFGFTSGRAWLEALRAELARRS